MGDEILPGNQLRLKKINKIVTSLSCPVLLPKNVLFLQDNAKLYTVHNTVETINKLLFVTLEHPSLQ